MLAFRTPLHVTVGLGMATATITAGCGTDPTCPDGTFVMGSTCVAIGPEASHRDGAVDGASPADASADAPNDQATDANDDAALADAGSVDGCSPGTFYADQDGDGFGDLATPVQACSPPDGYVDVDDDGDCDDDCGDCNPDALERCDSMDNDCDGQTDEQDAIDAATWYRDMDEDTYGDPDVTLRACAQPQGYVENDRDCHDDTALANPDGTWHADAIPGHPGDYDYDCDGNEEERWTEESSGACGGMGDCYLFEGWIDSPIPSCGGGGDWRTCTSHPSAGCGDLPPEPRDQQCR